MLFLDTNILIYAVSADPREARKQALAKQFVGKDDIAVSIQVLQEFFTQITRSGRAGAHSRMQAPHMVRGFLEGPVQDMTAEVLVSAIASSDRFRISYWDAAIIEAARAIGCEIVLSEDLNHGQDYDGVEVVNPFL